MIVKRTVSALVLASFLGLQPGIAPAAYAENAMNYRFLSAKDADALPKAGGTLGLNVGPGEQITSGGMTFRLLKVNSVKPGAAGAQAGFRKGDEIVSVDGRVFPTVPAFADYVGSVAPGKQINVDFLPAGGGPQEAQRVTATLGGPGAGGAAPAVATAPPEAQPGAEAPAQGGTLSTGTKVAIGAAAVALFGCYKLGCFNRFKRQPAGVR
ncbi:PDZ domain-containing protein [Lichenibacterium dinghuense]|uniref:PDZ domain-containing protein n=1 Tax=Lichenibacterium dinghuense TaxID=2895977 RepID=UPI001F459898|nr:PDZ domain-containing protein [Lichenibacterium sp. 6Y81]